jgi:hypothetical protein
MTSVNRLVISLACFLAGAQSVQAATIFRCNVNGRTVFQQSACASDEPASSAAPASGPARKTTKPAIAAAPASGASAPDKPAKPAKPG